MQVRVHDTTFYWVWISIQNKCNVTNSILVRVALTPLKVAGQLFYYLEDEKNKMSAIKKEQNVHLPGIRLHLQLHQCGDAQTLKKPDRSDYNKMSSFFVCSISLIANVGSQLSHLSVFLSSYQQNRKYRRADLRSISTWTPEMDKENLFFIISGNARYRWHDPFTETIPKLDINYNILRQT